MSWTREAMVWERAVTSARARRLGAKLSCSAAASTRAFVSAPTGWVEPDSTLEAVETDTPARRATSRREVLVRLMVTPARLMEEIVENV